MEAHDAVKALGPYDVVEVVLDDSATGRADAYKVVVSCHEKQRTRYRLGTYVEGTEGSVEATVGVCNAAGLGEEVEATAKVGSQSSSEGRLSVSRGRLGGRPLEGKAAVAQATHSYEPTSSFVERLRGGTVNVGSQEGEHAVAYELAWRTLTDPSRRASLPVRQQLGDHLKSAVSYALHRDRREVGYDGFYTSGCLLRRGSGILGLASVELAGVGLDANLLRFAKAQAGAAVAVPLGFFGSALSLRAEVGALLPWGPGFASQPTCISDRFFIGGVPSNLRGFAFKGAGPSAPRRRGEEEDGAGTDKRDALGGDLMCTLLAALHFPLPFEAPRALGLHGHVFLNGGSTEVLTGTGRPLQQGARDFLRSFRWSAGVGLVWPTTIGRLEVNWCRVLAHQPTDKVRHGIEVGFSPITT
ncbi:hypothetical protein WJX81_003706 [Elliptochloris bilobata]|uniref:Bacterial surface antigen (D15) domain-containing protein n=1 Tax=Elliptochloris bilobata TaxID=381761 RepID=A0AAW1RIG5_9CHLO